MLHLPTFPPCSNLIAYYIPDPLPIIITLATVSYIAYVIFDLVSNLPNLKINFQEANTALNNQRKFSKRSKENLINNPPNNEIWNKSKNHCNYNLTKKTSKKFKHYNK